MSFGCMLKIEETEILSCPHLTVALMHYPLIPFARVDNFYHISFYIHQQLPRIQCKNM